MIQRVKDLRRSVDYLQTRADIAADKMAFFGVSLGANRSGRSFWRSNRDSRPRCSGRGAAAEQLRAGSGSDQLRDARRDACRP